MRTQVVQYTSMYLEALRHGLGHPCLVSAPQPCSHLESRSTRPAAHLLRGTHAYLQAQEPWCQPRDPEQELHSALLQRRLLLGLRKLKLLQLAPP